ncbi:MAG TPA: pitrilysin family protein [Limnochordales bacterium]|nr:pitrilysin family protein [Limnochordales bacterium]
MHAQFETMAIDRGFHLHVAPTDKFKTTTIKLVLRRSLRAGEHTRTAVIPFVLRRGTQSLPTVRDIARHLENMYGAGFSVDIGKIGETQNIELFMEVAHDRFLPEKLGLTERALAFLGQVLLTPATEDGVFRREYVAQEAEHLRRRIQSTINHKPQYALKRLREEMCRGEPFGLHKYGDEAELGQVGPGQLYEHYRHLLASSPVDVFVVGPVEPGAVAGWVKEHLALPRGQVEGAIPAVQGPDPQGRPEQVVAEEQPVQQGVLALGYRTGTRYPDDDYPALLVYNGILGGFPHSKLFVNVREKASLAYFASSHLEASKGIMTVVAGIAAEKYPQALAIIREQVAALADGAIADQELEHTRKGLINALLSGRDSPGRIIGGRVVGLINGRVRPVPALIEEIRAVTRDDVVRVAQRVRPDTVYFLRSPAAGAEEEGH